MYLLLVESPTKSKTLKRFLGKEYKVLASYGHIRDLPKSELGVDVENNFRPKYIIPTKSRKIITLLKKESEKAEIVILACDQDREGEAIAWHIAQVLRLGKFQIPSFVRDNVGTTAGKPNSNPSTNSGLALSRIERAKSKTEETKPYQRIVFHEITKPAIEEALKNPREIDLNLVGAQQARRVLDRIVGYKLSPFLWKKLSRGLSAGRVQSVAVRLVVEREREIKNFIAQEYWSIEAILEKISAKADFKASLSAKDGKTIPKLGIKNEKEAKEIIGDLNGAPYQVANVEKKENRKNPLPPFTTSTLQQEAWQRFHFPASFTMKLAQGLYENGLISYHRTDSLNLSEQSLFDAKKFINEAYGEKYWAGYFRKYKAKAGAQEAHEAIRPTCPDRTPEQLGKAGEAGNKLYDLIWRRFIACQMAAAIFDSTAVEINAKNYTFRANGQTLKFDGFLKIYPMKFEENELPTLEKDEVLNLKEIIPLQHFTQPAARYTEATLIKALEEQGIGRPSTYAPTISTIQERNYIEKNEEKRFQPTEIGFSVNDLLVEHFPKIVDIKFTAKMEDDLDEIAQGKKKWVNVLAAFYSDFAENLSHKYEEVTKKNMIEETGKKCPECGANLVIRFGKFGKFIACSKFPECKHTETLEKNPLGIKCPKCAEGNVVERRTKRKKIFFGCSLWPKCDFASWDKPTGTLCEKCGAAIVETKRGQIKCSNKNCETNPPRQRKTR